MQGWCLSWEGPWGPLTSVEGRARPARPNPPAVRALSRPTAAREMELTAVQPLEYCTAYRGSRVARTAVQPFMHRQPMCFVLQLHNIPSNII